MSKIIINQSTDIILELISEDTDIFNRPRNQLRFKEFFKIIFISDKRILLENENLRSPEFLFKKIENLKNWFGTTHELVFNSQIEDSIKYLINSEKQFQEFTIEAKKIWRGEYQVEHFSNFCNIITKQLKGRTLYKLQLLSAYHLAFSQNACNFSVPGSGKTSIVYAAYAYLNSLNIQNSKFVNKLVIIGPPSSFKPWEEEFESCFLRKSRSLRINDSAVSKNFKNNILKGIEEENFDMLLFSYNSIPNYYLELLSYMNLSSNKVMMICDEAHKIKNYLGVWSENINKLAPYASSRVILTGTPCPNGYEDLYSLFNFIYPNKNVIQFKYQRLKSLTKNENQTLIKELIENIKPFFVRIKKSDLKLPNVTEHPIIYSDLNDLEIEIYDKLEKALVNQSDETLKFNLFFRLFQASNNICLLNKPFINEDLELFGFSPSAVNLTTILGEDLIEKLNQIQKNFIPNKFHEVLNLVKDLSRRGEKVLIWGLFIDSIKRLNNFLISNGLNGNYIIGETTLGKDKLNDQSNETREAILERFKNNPEMDYLISNPVVLGESISLHKSCHNAIYFELSYAAAPYIQSRDRIHRVWLDSNNNQIEYETNYYYIFNYRRLDERSFNRVTNKFSRMIQIIEHDIPLFLEDLDSERDELIKEIFDEYNKKSL